MASTPAVVPKSIKPSKADTAANAKFLKYLDQIEPLADPAEVALRKTVLHDLQKIVNRWVQAVSIKQGFAPDALKSACGKIFTFGSFRLGLITPASDIDALCVAPKHVSREDFFESLIPILEADAHVSELSGVPDAVVPIIKMKYKHVEVDLTFARLNLAVIDSKLDSLESNNLLRHLDEKTVRSINGTRVADALLSLVPKLETYITVLRFIRHWAKMRGLYSNAMGFFGGITWAILSARVCQMYPNYTPLQICSKFFLVFSRWNWNNPVTLCSITQSTEVGLMGFRVWNPKLNASDKYHLMPVITPAFPCMNSTYNVTETTKRIIISELARGLDILSTFTDDHAVLEKLVRSPPFLSLFNFYLVVDVFCHNETAYTKLKGFVESRVRMLLKAMESPSGGLQSIRPWPKEFETKTTGSENTHRSSWLVGLSLPPLKSGGAANVVDLRPAISQFHEKLNEWSENPNFQDGTDYSVRLFHVSRKSEFLKQLCTLESSKSLVNISVQEHLENLNRSDAGAVEPQASVWSAAAVATDEGLINKRRKLNLDVNLEVAT